MADMGGRFRTRYIDRESALATLGVLLSMADVLPASPLYNILRSTVILPDIPYRSLNPEQDMDNPRTC
jgi:hypothetical protein